MIELAPDGELTAVRFNNRSTGPITDEPFDAMAGTNYDSDGTCGAGFTLATPAQLNLGPLTFNGVGATLSHALLPGSIALDQAPDCTDFFENLVAADQVGVLRPQGSACDVGAFEAIQD